MNTDQIMEKLIPFGKEIWNLRKILVVAFLASVVLIAGILLLIPNEYESEIVLIPSQGENQSFNITNLASMVGLSGLSGGSEITILRTIPLLVQSEPVLLPLYNRKVKLSSESDSLELNQIYKIKGETERERHERFFRAIKKQLTINFDPKVNSVSIIIRTQNGVLSSLIVNSIYEALEKYLNEHFVEKAKQKRAWIENRLTEVSDSLMIAERELERFRTENRRIENSPRLLLQQERLGRDIQILLAVLVELRKQYEILRIEEIKTSPVLNPIQEAKVAALKAGPNRLSLLIGIVTLLWVAVAGLSLLLYINKDRLIQLKSFMREQTSAR